MNGRKTTGGLQQHRLEATMVDIGFTGDFNLSS